MTNHIFNSSLDMVIRYSQISTFDGVTLYVESARPPRKGFISAATPPPPLHVHVHVHVHVCTSVPGLGDETGRSLFDTKKPSTLTPQGGIVQRGTWKNSAFSKI